MTRLSTFINTETQRHRELIEGVPLISEIRGWI